MNTTPDETRLALWLDDELSGAELAQVEAWALAHPEQLAAREEIRRYRSGISALLPSREEVPYPEFFNSRVLREIRSDAAPVAVVERAVAPFWKGWLMPVAACAGMVLTFGIGKQSTVVEPQGAAMPDWSPVVYTPEVGVDAEWFASSQAEATVIVLQGVSAIPDSTDFSDTVYVPTNREGSRTADRPSSQTSKGQ